MKKQSCPACNGKNGSRRKDTFYGLDDKLDFIALRQDEVNLKSEEVLSFKQFEAAKILKLEAEAAFTGAGARLEEQLGKF